MWDLESALRPDGPFFLIAGPCVLEDDATNLAVAEEVARIGEAFGLPVIFKASFDKANRSSIDSPRGPGLDEGLMQLERVKSGLGIPVTTDVHTAEQAAPNCSVSCSLTTRPGFTGSRPAQPSTSKRSSA